MNKKSRIHIVEFNLIYFIRGGEKGKSYWIFVEQSLKYNNIIHQRFKYQSVRALVGTKILPSYLQPLQHNSKSISTLLHY